MESVRLSFNLQKSQILGYDNATQFANRQEFTIYAVEFDANFTSMDPLSIVRNMSMLILYNQSYIDLPNFYNMYNEDPISNNVLY